MKTYLACMAFLILAVLLLGNRLTAAAVDPASKPASMLMTDSSGTNGTHATTVPDSHSATAPNAPTSGKFSRWVHSFLLWGSGTNRNKARPAPTLNNVAGTNTATAKPSKLSTTLPVNSKTNVNHSAVALSSRRDAGRNGSANTNASVTRVSTKKDDPRNNSSTAFLPVASKTNAADARLALSLRQAESKNVSASTNTTVSRASAKKIETPGKPPTALLAVDSRTYVDHVEPASPLRSDAGANAPVNTNASVKLVTMETLDDKHRLAIGDRLSFRIEEDKYRLESGDRLGARSEDEPTPLLVTDSGELEVPYIGRFPAENKTCKQLAYELKAALEKDYFYKATVILAVDLKTKSRGRVYLTGAVHEPGPQEIPSDEVLTLGKVILRAGGFTDFAERHNVKVTRKVVGSSESKTLVVDVAEVFDKGKTERDLPLEPGDLIMVSERMIRF